MLEFLKAWYRRHFSDPQAILLVVILVFISAVILLLGGMLAPVFAAIVIAYLMEGTVKHMQKINIPRQLAVSIVFLLFLALLAFIVLGLIPLLSRQLTEFVQELPRMINEGQSVLNRLPELYPQFITVEQVRDVIWEIRKGITELGQNVLSLSLASIPAIITLLIYSILGPILVFFFLKDKGPILDWLTGFLPRDRKLLTVVWTDMDKQIGNYVRGKFYEIIIVGGVTFSVFSLMGLAYAPLLAVLVGLSVIIPYIGAAAVTVPVAVAGYFQFSWGGDFVWLMIGYFVIQILDGNLLVPVLFSEAVNLHPVSIIVAVLLFGGLWGFWGVFFAIPLATMVKSVLMAWPSTTEEVIMSPPVRKKVLKESEPVR